MLDGILKATFIRPDVGFPTRKDAAVGHLVFTFDLYCHKNHACDSSEGNTAHHSRCRVTTSTALAEVRNPEYRNIQATRQINQWLQCASDFGIFVTVTRNRRHNGINDQELDVTNAFGLCFQRCQITRRITSASTVRPIITIVSPRPSACR